MICMCLDCTTTLHTLHGLSLRVLFLHSTTSYNICHIQLRSTAFSPTIHAQTPPDLTTQSSDSPLALAKRDSIDSTILKYHATGTRQKQGSQQPDGKHRKSHKIPQMIAKSKKTCSKTWDVLMSSWCIDQNWLGIQPARTAGKCDAPTTEPSVHRHPPAQAAPADIVTVYTSGKKKI